MSGSPCKTIHQDLLKLGGGELLSYLQGLSTDEAGFHYEAMWRLVFISGVMGYKYSCLGRDSKIRTVSDVLSASVRNGNAEGCADYRLQHGVTVLRGSSKFFNDDRQRSMEKYDLDKLNREANGTGAMFLCVRSRSEVLRKLKRCQEPKFRDWLRGEDGNYRVYGYIELVRYWQRLRELKIDQWISPQPPLHLLPHQEWTVRRSVELYQNGKMEILFHHLMRMGKTVMAAGVVDRLQPLRVLIVTPQPSETYKQYGEETFQLYSNFTRYRIITVERSLRTYNLAELNAPYTIVIISKQALDANPQRLKDITKFNLLFSDENDFAGTTNRLWRNMQKLRDAAALTIYMTYTASKTIVYHAIPQEARLGFELWDIGDMARLEDADCGDAVERLEARYPGLVAIAREEEHPAVWYKAQPTPYFMTVRGMSEQVQALLSRYRETDYGYNLNTVLTLTPDQKDFQNPQAVRAVITTLVGEDGTDDYPPQLVPRNQSCFQRMQMTAGGGLKKWFHVIFIPYVKGESFVARAKAFQLYLQQHQRLKRYSIKIVSGGMERKSDLKSQIAQWYKDSNDGLIVLACNMLRRAVSLPKLDSVILLDSTLSADKYIQTIFRPMTSEAGKKHGYIVDFQEGHVLRALSVILRDEIIPPTKDDDSEALNNLRRIANCFYLDGLRGEQIPIEQLKGILQQYRDFTSNEKYQILHPKIFIDFGDFTDDSFKLLEYFQGIRQKEQRSPSLGDLRIDPEGEEVADLPSGLFAEEEEERPVRARNPRFIKMLKSLDQELIPLIQLAVLVCPSSATSNLAFLLSQIEASADAAFLFQEIVGLRAPRLQTAEQKERLSPLIRSPAPPSQPALGILLKAVQDSKMSGQPSVMNLIAETQAQLTASLEEPEVYYNFFIATLGNPTNLEVAAYGEVYTPLSLVRQMLDRLPMELWNNPSLRWLEPACGLAPFLFEVYQRLMTGLQTVVGYEDPEIRRRHILENMLYFNEIQPKNLALVKVLFRAGNYRLNIFEGDALVQGTIPANFQADVIVGNPPYNAPGSQRNIIWDDFIRRILNTPWLKPGGYLLLVHPPIWRQAPSPNAVTKDLYNLLTVKNQLLYLSMHDAKAGQTTFRCGTKYDWYLLHAVPRHTTTVVRCEHGHEQVLDLEQWPWLPNTHFQHLIQLMKVKGEKGAELLFKYTYETRKDTVSAVKSEEFVYPLVHSTPETGTRFYYTNTRDASIFDPLKVIFGDSGINAPVVDLEGRYGMTQHSMALVVRDAEDATACVSVLTSPIFNEILKACRWSNYQIKWSLFSGLRAGFWRDFACDIPLAPVSPLAPESSSSSTLNQARLEASSGRSKEGYTQKQLFELCQSLGIAASKSEAKSKLIEKLRVRC